MTNHAILNYDGHKDLKVNTQYSPDDSIMCTLAIPSEFRSLQADYPIFFHQNPDTGKFLPMVMFGFEEGENLYLNGSEWDATHIPLMIERGPFLVGFQSTIDSSSQSGNTDKKMVVSIDLDNPKVSDNKGEPLFLPFGGNSLYTDRIVEVLQEIDHGQEVIKEFVDALEQQDLLESFSLDVELNNGNKHRLEGFYTIHEEKLSTLEADVLADFSRRGILMAAYMVLASMSNIRRMIDLKNRRLSLSS